MTVTNLAEPQPDHAERMTKFALEAIQVASQTLVDESDPSLGCLEIRIGMRTLINHLPVAAVSVSHCMAFTDSGPVVAQVVGSRTPRYSVIGDTVNTAAVSFCGLIHGNISHNNQQRFESASQPGCIHCSRVTASLLEGCQRFNVVNRGLFDVKGKDAMVGYWVSAKEKCNSVELPTTVDDETNLSLVAI